LNRHRALFALGYRLVECPYSQPPLATDQEAFDDVMLLVYQGGGIGDGNAGGSTWFDGQIPSIFPHEFIVDFFMSVYPDTTGEYSELKNDGNVLPFKDHRCYKLSKWFAENNFYATIKPDLPWKDVANKYEQAYDAEEAGRVNDSQYDHRDVVAVIGAGAAGLSAAIQIAKKSTSPVLVKLIEANDFVGGRIRTIITSGDMDGEQYVDKQLVDKCKPFAPWPVPIGAEFVHGVDSVINDMIEEKEWRAEETFDFCATDEYPSRNSFTVRDLTASLSARQRKSSLIKIFGGGRCWDLKNPHRDTDNDSDGQSYGLLIKKANEVWDELYSVGDDVLSDRKGSIPPDMSLSTFIEQKMEGSSKDEVDAVKQILDAVYAKTAGSSLENYGVNEACKEELSWDYTESNFRTERCFAEIVNHYLEQIESINRSFEIGESKGMVEIIKSTPIVKIGCGDKSKVMLSSRDGKQFTCDKVIVAVPLGVLKADKIQFCDDFSLPPEKKLAIEKINFFSGMKAHMLLRKGPSPSLETTDLFFCPGEIFSQVWVRRNEESIFLTGFVVANGRDQLLAEMKKTHKTSHNIFLNQLQRMLPNEIGDNACTAFELHDWSEDEFVMGLYSSPSVGAGWKLSGHCDEQVLETSRDDIKSPIRNTVYFAGEHANVKTCATVQAAVESGLIAATDVLQSLVEGGKINM
jgi:monoamine oxidase